MGARRDSTASKDSRVSKPDSQPEPRSLKERFVWEPEDVSDAPSKGDSQASGD